MRRLPLDEVGRLRNLRRILAALLVAMAALLPVAARSMPVSRSMPAAAHRHGPHAGGVERTALGHGADCAGHRHAPARPHHPCEGCAMACCAPAMIATPASPMPVAAAPATIARPALPPADRRYEEAARGERLRPPISL